jgi:hypothetical protein
VSGDTASAGPVRSHRRPIDRLGAGAVDAQRCVRHTHASDPAEHDVKTVAKLDLGRNALGLPSGLLTPNLDSVLQA